MISGVASTLPSRRTELLLVPLDDSGGGIIKDPRAARYYRLGEQEYFLLGQLDGTRSKPSICQAYEARFGEPLTEEELDLFIKLASSQGLLDLEPAQQPDAATGRGGATTNTATSRTNPSLRRPQNWLAWRKCLFDPDRFFTWLEPKLRFCWTRGFVLFSAAWIVSSFFLAWSNRHELVTHFASAWRWETLVLAWFTLVLITTLHEFAHGLTCKHFGGQVHEVGVLVLFLMPCLYCNVSDAWLFPQKSRRIWVTLAGGYFDLVIWAAAVTLWRITPQSSLVNYLAWIVLTSAGVRTLFNFNPLLKLDGYYLLSDLLEIPNLRQRGLDRFTGYVRWLLWGAVRPAATARGRFLLVYGLICLAFSSVFLLSMLVGFGYALKARIGWIGMLTITALGVYLFRGLFKGILGGEVRAMLRNRHRRTVGWILLAIASGLVLTFVEVEDRASGPVQIRPQKRIELRAPLAGFLKEIQFEEYEEVSAGAVVAVLEVPDLDSRIRQKQAEIQEGQARLTLFQSGARQEELLEQQARVTRLQRRAELAGESFARARQAYAEELARWDRQIEKDRTELQFLRVSLDNADGLLRERAIAVEQHQERQKAVALAEQQLRLSEAQRRVRAAEGTVEAEQELATREQELAEASSALRLLQAGTRAEEIAAQAALVARLEEELRFLHEQKERCLVRSRIAGRIITPRADEKLGSYLHEGELICEVVEPRALEAEVAISEGHIWQVAMGQPVRIKLNALPLDTLQAKVVRVAPATVFGTAPSDGSSAALQFAGFARPPASQPDTVVVTCELPPGQPGLRPGMTGWGRILTTRRSLGRILMDRCLKFVRTEFWW